jgi:hypothetical protein
MVRAFRNPLGRFVRRGKESRIDNMYTCIIELFFSSCPKLRVSMSYKQSGLSSNITTYTV